jgi:hypothetical protein
LLVLSLSGIWWQSSYIFNTKEVLIKEHWERYQNNIPQYYSIQNGQIIEGNIPEEKKENE